jgi:hypothetical protein
MVAHFAAATVAWALVAGGGWLAGRAVRMAASTREAREVRGQPERGGRRGLAVRRGA